MNKIKIFITTGEDYYRDLSKEQQKHVLYIGDVNTIQADYWIDYKIILPKTPSNTIIDKCNKWILDNQYKLVTTSNKQYYTTIYL